MTHHVTDASDGSVQEIAVNDRNPIVTAQGDAATTSAKGGGSATPLSQPSEEKPEPLTTPPADQQDDWQMIDESDTPFTKRGPGRPRRPITAETAADKIVKLPLDKLLSHPLNKKLYGETAPDEIEKLAESIVETGQLAPLVVTADLTKVGYYALLSGHKRADALRSLGRTEANCQLVDVKNSDERLLRLLEANRQHVPTTEQKIHIGEVHFDLETKKAKARQVAGAKGAKKSGEAVEVFTQATPPPETGDDTAGKARDHAAAKVGMSGVSFDKGRKVLRAMEKAEAEGKTASVARLRELLNEKGVEPACEHAKVLNLIEKACRKGGAGGKTQGSGPAAKGVGSNPVVAAVVPLKNSPSPASTVQAIDVRGTNTLPYESNAFARHDITFDRRLFANHQWHLGPPFHHRAQPFPVQKPVRLLPQHAGRVRPRLPVLLCARNFYQQAQAGARQNGRARP